MSTLIKKPFIESVIDTLNPAEISSLAGMLDGADSTIFRSLINEAYPITEAIGLYPLPSMARRQPSMPSRERGS